MSSSLGKLRMDSARKIETGRYPVGSMVVDDFDLTSLCDLPSDRFLEDEEEDEEDDLEVLRETRCIRLRRHKVPLGVANSVKAEEDAMKPFIFISDADPCTSICMAIATCSTFTSPSSPASSLAASRTCSNNSIAAADHP